MICALSTIAAVLWLCLLRAPVTPDFLRPIFSSLLGEVCVRIVGIALLLVSLICWISQYGPAVGLSLALATIMLVGAPLPFLMPHKRYRSLLHLTLALSLGSWAFFELTS